MLEVADAYGRGGKAKEAEAVAKKAESLMQDPKHRRDRIRIAADRRQGLDEALKLATAELAARQDVETRDLAAWALSQAGKGDEAIAAIEPALALGAADARLWYHAGVIFQRAGKADRSREAFERSRKINPQFRPAGGKTPPPAPRTIEPSQASKRARSRRRSARTRGRGGSVVPPRPILIFARSKDCAVT